MTKTQEILLVMANNPGDSMTTFEIMKEVNKPQKYISAILNQQEDMGKVIRIGKNTYSITSYGKQSLHTTQGDLERTIEILEEQLIEKRRVVKKLLKRKLRYERKLKEFLYRTKNKNGISKESQETQISY